MKTLLRSLLVLLAVSASGQIMMPGADAFLGAAVLNQSAGGGSYEVEDLFTGADDTLLSDHTTTTGGYSWSVVDPAYRIKGNVITNTVDGVSHYSRYFLSHTMSSADYTATIDVLYFGEGSGTPCLAIRDTGAAFATRTAYFVLFTKGSTTGQLWKVVNGTPTQLGTDLSVGGVATNLWLSASGTAITAKVNTLTVPGCPVTDSDITGAGTVGLGGGYRDNDNSYGLTLDNLRVSVP